LNFNELIENKKIIKALEEMNIFEATPIQTESIPLLLDHNDVIGQAQTGTGKTFAYAIPLIENINDESKNIEALVLTPTRELSIQVAKEIEKLSKDIKKLKISTIYGGESYDKQFDSLKRNPQIVIGTPGRIIDMMERGKLKFDNVKYLVLDEADEMLKMGFEDDLETILKETPKNRQTALFSATLPPFIKNVSKKYMIDPKFVKIDAKSLTVENINQMVYYVKRESKKDLLLRLLDLYEFNSVMIFTNTKSMVDELVLYLQSLNFKADGLHGDLKQKSRERVMDAYRTGAINILIATDVAARGIDVSGIEAVINYDIPNEDELYVHRIGRTARAGI
jgi:ATP-dependent RNA helicase DeaD